MRGSMNFSRGSGGGGVQLQIMVGSASDQVGGPTNSTFKSPGKSRGGGPVPHPLDPCMDLRP